MADDSNQNLGVDDTEDLEEDDEEYDDEEYDDEDDEY